MYYFAKVIELIFLSYTILLFVRIIGSWFPKFSSHPIMRFIMWCTDPYLNIFRKIIPPIGGMLDLSPLLAFFALRLVEKFLLSFLR